MPYASNTDLLDMGFVKEQFGASAQGDFPGYLGNVLAKATGEVKRQITEAAYNAASGLRRDLLADAEVLFAASILYRRRAANQDANAKIATEKSGYLTLREYENLADRYEARFREKVADFLADGGPDPGASMGHIETGPFPAHSSTRLN